MENSLTNCVSCPRDCKVNRELQVGYCGTKSNIKVAKAFLHKWEEPCISGTNGSGTVFFTGCNLKCVFCQNYKISQEYFGKEISIDDLSQIILRLQKDGAHNINFVSPSHYVINIKKCLEGLGDALHIPIIYNTNGYDSVESLRILDNYVDVYLPDIKYYKNDTAIKYSKAPHYFDVATKAVIEMYRQTGKLVLDENGLIKSGLIIRHLIIPGLTNESIKILDWIKNNLPTDDIIISLMCQYTPFYNANKYTEINREIIRKEYDKVLNFFIKSGFKNGYMQEKESADTKFIPDFNLEGV